MFWSDVEKNTKRIRWRKSHSKIETDDEFGLAKQSKGSIRAIFYCIRKPGKPRHESQNPLSPQAEKYDRTERPVVCSQRASQFVIEDDETESVLSLGSRSFLHRVNDQVRKRQKQSSKDAIEDSDKHSVVWWMFKSSTLQASVFTGKNYSDNWHSIKKTEDLTMKQTLDTPEKLITEQSDEIYGMSTSNWEHSSWKYLSLIGDEQVFSLQQRWWKIVFSLLCRPGNDLNCFSHNYFCKSAQSLRVSRRNVWRIWIQPRKNGRTRCERTIEFLVRAKCDQEKHAFEWWWSCA